MSPLLFFTYSMPPHRHPAPRAQNFIRIRSWYKVEKRCFTKIYLVYFSKTICFTKIYLVDFNKTNCFTKIYQVDFSKSNFYTCQRHSSWVCVAPNVGFS